MLPAPLTCVAVLKVAELQNVIPKLPAILESPWLNSYTPWMGVIYCFLSYTELKDNNVEFAEGGNYKQSLRPGKHITEA